MAVADLRSRLSELPTSAITSKRKPPVGAVANVWSGPPPIE